MWNSVDLGEDGRKSGTSPFPTCQVLRVWEGSFLYLLFIVSLLH